MIRSVGRPKKIQSRDILINSINEYFNSTLEQKITVTGLCLFLGINKDTFYEYAKNEEFGDVITEARMMVENSYELSLRENGRTGDIFALKNFGWKDKTESEITFNDSFADQLRKARERLKK